MFKIKIIQKYIFLIYKEKKFNFFYQKNLLSPQLFIHKQKNFVMTKITNFITVIACIACLTAQINSVSAQWIPGGSVNGNGSASNPWEITTITHLTELATYVNAGNGPHTAGKYYKLMNDVDYNSVPQSFVGWSPIGDNQTIGATFRGNFDGNGKQVANIRINRGAISYIGLFGYISSANIHDLGLEGYQAIGNYYVSSLARIAENSIIENCYATGTITGFSCLGGLIGINSSSTIRNCYAICDVIGYSAVGGLVGINSIGSINYCYATGDITGPGGTYFGGLVGNNNGTLRNCVAANDTVSGGISNINRIVGNTVGGALSNNYAFTGMVITPIGGVPGISAPMDTLMSYNFYNTGSNWYNNIPWSMDTDDNPLESWKICDGETLPFLQWEGLSCSKKSPFAENQKKEYAAVQFGQQLLVIAPNPVSGMVTISATDEMQQLDLFDFTGRLLKSQTHASEQMSFNTEGLPPGIYIVQARLKEGNMQRGKLIVK
jgi:hypothetical protein